MDQFIRIAQFPSYPTSSRNAVPSPSFEASGFWAQKHPRCHSQIAASRISVSVSTSLGTIDGAWIVVRSRANSQITISPVPIAAAMMIDVKLSSATAAESALHKTTALPTDATASTGYQPLTFFRSD